jgi:ADP-ribose pyrophosphatase
MLYHLILTFAGGCPLCCRHKFPQINPLLLAQGENIGENRSILRRLVTELLDRLESSMPHVPLPLRSIFSRLQSKMERRHNTATSIAGVGRCWLLQLVGVCLTCPEKIPQFGATELSSAVRRGLLLLSKLLQELLSFKPAREDYMQKMDSFLKSKTGQVKRLLLSVSAKSKSTTAIETYFAFKQQPVELTALEILGPWGNGSNTLGVCGSSVHHLVQTFQLHHAEIVELLPTQILCDQFTKELIKFTTHQKRAGNQSKGSASECFLSARTIDLSALIANPRESLHLEAPLNVCYPHTSIRRGAVAVPKWHTICPAYAPVEYTDASVANCDPDILSTTFQEVLMFNLVDNHSNVDRRSHLGTYKVLQGVPRNPIERTGITGRGSLTLWGPNHRADPVVTRWQRDQAAGTVVTKDGCPVLEVLLVSSPETHVFSLPTGAVNTGALLPEMLTHVFGAACTTSNLNEGTRRRTTTARSYDSTFTERVRIFNDKDAKPIAAHATKSHCLGSETVPATIKDLFSSGKCLFKGYEQSLFNTDNAWIETSIVNYHDNGTAFETHSIGLSEAYTKLGGQLCWMPVDEALNLNAKHREVIVQVVEERGAHFVDKLSPIIKGLITAIESKGLRTEGLYRLSGLQSNVKQLKAEALAGTVGDFSHITDVHELTGALKMILREMPIPLLTFVLYRMCLAVGNSMREDHMEELLLAMPRTNWNILLPLLHHLQRVAGFASMNRMSIDNVAIVFGPTMMRSPDGLSGDLQDYKLQCQVAKAMMKLSAETLDAIACKRGEPGYTTPRLSHASFSIYSNSEGQQQQDQQQQEAKDALVSNQKNTSTFRKMNGSGSDEIMVVEDQKIKLNLLELELETDSVVDSVDFDEENEQQLPANLMEEDCVVGDCTNCESSQVIGKYSEEDCEFFCSTCWACYEHDGEEPKEEPGKVLQLTASDDLTQDESLVLATISEVDEMIANDSKDVSAEDGLPVDDPRMGDEEEKEEETLFDADGLPVCSGTDQLEWEERAPHKVRPGLDSLSQAEVMLIASPLCKRKADVRKLSKVAAKHLQRREGFAFRFVGKSWRKIFVVVQGTMLKVYKKKTSSDAEYTNLTEDILQFRVSGRELFLGGSGLKKGGCSQHFLFGSKAEALEWGRVLKNVARCLTALGTEA